MVKRHESMLNFLVRNAVYGVVPGMWFAYIAGISPLWGAAGGLALTFLIGLPARLVRERDEEDPAQD